MSTVGDLERDTELETVGERRFRALLSQDWEIWGPMGGYVAACALRAAGKVSPHPFPAALSCHYLGVGRFEPIDITVDTRRSGRSATSLRVEVSQSGRSILDAMVWSTGQGEGLEHDETRPPDVPGPASLPSMAELVPRRPLGLTGSGTTLMPSPSTSNPFGRQKDLVERCGNNGCGSSQRQHSQIRGLTLQGR